jgi:hypothetical protein
LATEITGALIHPEVTQRAPSEDQGESGPGDQEIAQPEVEDDRDQDPKRP